MKLFGRGKKTIFERFSEHADKVFETVKLTDKAVDVYFNKGDLQEIINDISKVETEADSVYYDIARDLFKGQLLPYTSEDWFELLDHVDNIADNSDRIAKFLLVYRVKVDEKLKNRIKELMKISCEAARIIKESIEMMRHDMEGAAEKASEVAEIRHHARNIEYMLFKELFNSKMPTKRLLLLKEIVYWITQVSNSSKRAANRIIMMSVKYSF